MLMAPAFILIRTTDGDIVYRMDIVHEAHDIHHNNTFRCPVPHTHIRGIDP